MKIDILDLSESPSHESRLVSIYNIVEVIFDLENPLVRDNFATY